MTGYEQSPDYGSGYLPWWVYPLGVGVILAVVLWASGALAKTDLSHRP